LSHDLQQYKKGDSNISVSIMYLYYNLNITTSIACPNIVYSNSIFIFILFIENAK
jgi:hypothetical protein